MPKNIVLLSDGTGNSSANIVKTNVWRLYEALDLTDPTRQVACYDDGVGTSSFKPLTVLGGIFGVGLKRNVLHLYRFLCEHYEPGDRIYAFGFSRGAFTIRVLAGLIADQGLVRTPRGARPGPPTGPGESTSGREAALLADDTRDQGEPAGAFGPELARLSRWAYRRFRRLFNQTGNLSLVPTARWLRDRLVRLTEWAAGHAPYAPAHNLAIDEITFLGLWDTVDAYGLPIDELTDGIDKWVWPLSMPSLELSPKVRKACHVLALDDERNTFHPMLWDESKEPQDRTHTRDERISQVWFAGMHANVGGGYPDDAVALVSLKWMSDQASAHGLQFVPTLIEHHTAKRDPIGRIYDSRAGLKSYYRYNPRRIEFLTNGQAHERGFFNRRWPRPNPTVSVERVKIHESVFTRIASAPDAYAPIVLPSRYAVVMDDGRIVEGAANPYETPEASAARGLAQEQAWNLVWWRRIAYFATVFASAWLVARPFAGGPTGEIPPAELTLAARAILAVGDYVPDLASRWINYFATVPSDLLLGGGVIVALMAAGGHLRGAICSTMRRIWIASSSGRPTALRRLASPSGFVYALRRQPTYQGAFAVLRRHVLPTVFGVGVLAMLVGIVNRAPFEIASGMGTVCRPDALGPSAATFRTDALCTATGYRLDAARRYRITVTPDPSAPWRDLQIPVPSPGGFATWSPDLSLSQRLRFAAFVPFRRVWTAHWYAPVAQVGEQGWDDYPIAGGSAEITARTSGSLYIFVNDVIFPIGPFTVRFGWSAYYSNNQGVGHVSVCRVEGDECVPVAPAAMGAPSDTPRR